MRQAVRKRVRQEKRQRSRRVLLRVFQLIVAADRKSTRLNSSHLVISYAVFCLKKQLELDGNYVESRRFILYFNILCKTENKVDHRGDVAGGGLTTAEMVVDNTHADGLIEISLN